MNIKPCSEYAILSFIEGSRTTVSNNESVEFAYLGRPIYFFSQRKSIEIGQNEPMEPKVENFKETRLVGKKLSMSFTNNKTVELWKSFAPRRKEIKNSAGSELYSVELYNDASFFKNFNPMKEFEKWAAVAVEDFESIPDGMDKLVIPEGRYAVFPYKGKPSEAQGTLQYIYGTWLPNSTYEMDNRPYFALMGEKYKGEDPDSEEEFWIPIF